MVRAVIYCRVSKQDQPKNFSLPLQQKACLDYCERERYKLAAIFVDEGESAHSEFEPNYLLAEKKWKPFGELQPHLEISQNSRIAEVG